MQRRKVDFPEPDGPMMHMTSPVADLEGDARRTSWRPKRLRTPSASTITRGHGRSLTKGAPYTSTEAAEPCFPRSDQQAPAQPLQGRGWELADAPFA